jgi:sugar lactone lactonase YvrE
LFGSSCLDAFSPRGESLQRIDLLVPTPTSCVLSGNALFITTAYDGLDDQQRQEFPLSGHVFVIDNYAA